MLFENALIARVCHDLITPFNAINLGLEAFDMSKDMSLLENVKESTTKANVVLKFMRELYSSKSETFRYTAVSLKQLVSDYLRSYSIAFDLKTEDENISVVVGRLIMYIGIVTKEIMPFGGVVRAKIDNATNQLTVTCAGRSVSIPDLIVNEELTHKNVIRHSLTRLLSENGLVPTVIQEGEDVVISIPVSVNPQYGQ